MAKQNAPAIPPESRLTYRPDIDGLRAVAVLLVVVNHLRAEWLPGGFIGVDVFFVISGYLITRMILDQRAGSGFRFSAFYLRRAQRLLPALFVMMLFVLAAGYLLLLPSDLSQLAASALSAVGLSSNLYFWLTTGGYFAPEAASLPLLHLWSLSLEEQFYFIWPALLILMTRFGRAWVPVLLLAIASFAWAQVSATHNPTAAYYLLPSRAGEFLLGALLVLAPGLKSAQPKQGAAQLLGGVGLATIVASAFLLSQKSTFPGLWALVPCLGAAAIIAAPFFGKGFAGSLLAAPPLRGIGRISYSVYLWHWPIISYLHLTRVAITAPVALAVLALSLALGALSWAALERDFRAGLDRGSRLFWAIGLGCILALLGISGLILWRSGFPERFPFVLLTQDQLTTERGRYWKGLPALNTVFSPQDQGRRLLIIGNSHAYDLTYALTGAGYEGKVKLMPTQWTCYDFGHDPILPTYAVQCRQIWSGVLNSPALRAATTVYLHDNWGAFDGDNLTQALTDLRQVTKVPIVVFGPKMSFTDDVLAISKAAQSKRFVTARDINVFARSYYDADKIARDQALKRYFADHPRPGVAYVSLMDLQCGQPLVCDILSSDGRYLYFDSGHFTLDGSHRMGQRLKAAKPDLF